MGAWLRIGAIDDAPAAGAMRAFVLDLERTVCVARLDDGALVCFDDTCTHEECPLSDGDLEGDRVVCFCHSGEFDVRTGAVLKGPPEEPVAVYELREHDGGLEIQLPD